MSRIIRDDEKETYCLNCNCRIGYFPEDIYTNSNAYDSEMKDIRIKCPNKNCGCSVLLNVMDR